MVIINKAIYNNFVFRVSRNFHWISRKFCTKFNFVFPEILRKHENENFRSHPTSTLLMDSIRVCHLCSFRFHFLFWKISISSFKCAIISAAASSVHPVLAGPSLYTQPNPINPSPASTPSFILYIHPQLLHPASAFTYNLSLYTHPQPLHPASAQRQKCWLWLWSYSIKAWLRLSNTIGDTWFIKLRLERRQGTMKK